MGDSRICSAPFVPKLTEEQVFARLVAEHLVFHRHKRGWSKLRLAQKAGVDQRTITFVEDGVNVPSLVTLFVICKALKVNVGAVVGKAARGKHPPVNPVTPVTAGRKQGAKRRGAPSLASRKL